MITTDVDIIFSLRSAGIHLLQIINKYYFIFHNLHYLADYVICNRYTPVFLSLIDLFVIFLFRFLYVFVCLLVNPKSCNLIGLECQGEREFLLKQIWVLIMEILQVFADALSIITISSCLILKFPQILSINRVKSAEGISIYSLLLELSR